MSPPSGTTSYNDVSSAALFSDATYNYPLEPAINQTNNDASIDMYVVKFSSLGVNIDWPLEINDGIIHGLEQIVEIPIE